MGNSQLAARRRTAGAPRRVRKLETAERAEEVLDRLRAAGILINRTGLKGNVLKIRRPLVL
jgi:4-aminobutyrate aminotransferase-like enzyme